MQLELARIFLFQSNKLLTAIMTIKDAMEDLCLMFLNMLSQTYGKANNNILIRVMKETAIIFEIEDIKYLMDIKHFMDLNKF